ncbi:MAG: T9SS type A sorting domain-containing protein [Ferruginibacter sp.]
MRHFYYFHMNKMTIVAQSFKKITLFLMLNFLFTSTYSQQEMRNPEVIVGQLIKVIPSLKDYKTPAGFHPQITRDRDGLVGVDEDNEEIKRIQYTKTPVPDPVVQRDFTARQNTINSPTPSPSGPSAITQNFAGLGYTNVSPADPSMCAGPTAIIQTINNNSSSYFKIWDLNGNVLLNQTLIVNLVASSGYTGQGDPVAIYDQLAGRYLLTEFGRAPASSGNPNSLIVCVSQTNNPLGAWYIYKFTDASFFPDYPHWSAWPNAYYATTNDFSGSYVGSSVWAFNKAKMLAGDATAEVQRFRLTNPDFKYSSMAPVNVIGSTAPAAGSPGMFMYFNDDDFTTNPNDKDSLGFISFLPDFATPANTVLSFSQQLMTAPFKSGVCGGRNCVPSLTGGGYDALSDRIMNRVVYRNFGSYEAIVLNYTVDANVGLGSPQAGIRWYELRRIGGAWSIFQQSTYAPVGTEWRWMGSININSKGQIALGYDLSSPSKYASIYFTGRNATDALNTMSVQEQLIKAGTGYGTFGNRWGDYNEVTNDVVNDSLFWMTSMYGNLSTSWATQVAQFRIGDCDITSSAMNLSQSAPAVQEGQNIVYTNTVSNTGCVTMSNFLLTDTLPTNVTFVSATNGGSYNAGNRVVSWPVNINAGLTQTYVLAVNINAGSYFAPFTHLNEAVPGPGIPTGWAATIGAGPVNWVLSSTQFHSAPSSFFAVDYASAGTDFRMSTTTPAVLAATPATLTFWHNFNTESGWDGGVVEISTNGGGTWVDLGNNMTVNRYNNTVGTGSNNPIAPRAAFSGNSGGWIQTKARLLPTSVNALIRFRMSSDDNTAPAGGGWYVDDVVLQTIAEVNIRSNLFNPSGSRIAVLDTFVTIIPNVGCTGQAISAQPTNTTSCAGTTATFTVTATGSAPITYQWQVSTTGPGGPWNNILNSGIYSGATSGTLTITGVTSGMSGYQYRSVVSGCSSPVTSNPVILTVATTISGGTVTPATIAVCSGLNTSFSVAAAGSGLAYQWQVSTNNGGTWTNLPGETNATLNIPSVNLSMNNNQYRVTLNGTCSSNTISNAVILSVLAPVVINNQPQNFSGCAGASAIYSVAATGNSLTYQWQESINAGAFSNISNGGNYSGATTNSLTIANLPLNMTGNTYRVIVTGTPCGAVTSNVATLTVNASPIPVLTISSYPAITPYTRTGIYVTVSPPGVYTYQWYKNSQPDLAHTGSFFNASVDDFGEYYVVVTNTNTGCFNSTNRVTLRDSASNLLFIIPNPTTGNFTVSYHTITTGIVRSINVYDAKGARVFTRAYNISRFYERMEVNLKNAASGVYLVELLDSKGLRIANGKVVIKK